MADLTLNIEGVLRKIDELDYEMQILGNKASCIVIHPTTFNRLVEELNRLYLIRITKYELDNIEIINSNGTKLKVYRSFDIQEYDVKVF